MKQAPLSYVLQVPLENGYLILSKFAKYKGTLQSKGEKEKEKYFYRNLSNNVFLVWGWCLICVLGGKIKSGAERKRHEGP